MLKWGSHFLQVKKRFEDHLGEKGAVAIDLGGGLYGITGSGVK
ncbi:hypothetical protein CCP3SC1AL1_2210005 [Gammaproteobacteria bacterium]